MVIDQRCIQTHKEAGEEDKERKLSTTVEGGRGGGMSWVVVEPPEQDIIISYNS